MDDVRNRLIGVIREALGREVETESFSSSELVTVLGLSSVDSIEILIRIESEFGIRVDDEDLDLKLLSSLDRLEDYVIRRLPKSA